MNLNNFNPNNMSQQDINRLMEMFMQNMNNSSNNNGYNNGGSHRRHRR